MHRWLAKKWVKIVLVLLAAIALFCGGVALGSGRNSGKVQQATKPAVVAPSPAPTTNITSTPQPVPVTVIVNPPVVNVTVTQTVNGIETQSSLQKSTTSSCLYGLRLGVLEGLVYAGNFNDYKGTIKESVIDHSWGSGGPFDLTRFSVKWRGSVLIEDEEAGCYRFTVRADDYIQLYIDDKCVIDKWMSPQPATNYTADIQLAEGAHKILLKYFNDVAGDSVIKLFYQRIY